MSYSVIAFDFDGTLVDSRDAIVNAMQKAFTDYKLTPPTREEIYNSMGSPVEKTFPIFHGNSVDAETNMKLVWHYRALYDEESKTNLRLYPGIKELLSDLRAAKKRVGVVTSKEAKAAWANSRQLGIAEFIEEVVGPHEVIMPKPSGEPVVVLCAKFGVEDIANHTIVVGDATFDIEMANNAGVDSVAVTWGARDEAALTVSGPTYIANTTPELAKILLS